MGVVYSSQRVVATVYSKRVGLCAKWIHFESYLVLDEELIVIKLR